MTASTQPGQPPTELLAVERAVRATLGEYCHRVDDGDNAGLAELFTPDGVFTFGELSAHGRDEIVQFFETTSGRPAQRGKHLTVNTVVTPGEGGDLTVRAVSDFVFLRFRQGHLIPLMAGRYDDELVFLDGRFRFARRDARAIRPPSE